MLVAVSLLLPNVLFALRRLLVAISCFFVVARQRHNVHRGLAVTGSRSRNVETSDRYRPPACPPSLERAARGHELQELSQAKGGVALPHGDNAADRLSTDQVQPYTANLRSLSSVRCAVHLRYAPLAESCLQSYANAPPDAVPKKRGPKTDVLEALLKRVDGLEKRLHSEGKSDELVEELSSALHDAADNSKATKASPTQPTVDTALNHANANNTNQLMSPIEPRYDLQLPCPGSSSFHMLTASSIQTPTLAPDLLLDTYFARIHGKPYHILDEATTRQRLQANQLPSHLAFAIYAVSAR